MLRHEQETAPSSDHGDTELARRHGGIAFSEGTKGTETSMVFFVPFVISEKGLLGASVLPPSLREK
jgi:hypothetical protein